MSSTNRGGQRSEADNYPTPAWAVHRLLEKLKLPGGHWLEPGGGEGNIIRAVNELRTDVTWWSAELREECRAPLVELCGSAERVAIGDYLDASVPFPLVPPGMLFDVALGNPPFHLAMEFIERSFLFAKRVALLLRLNFVGSDTRREWMQTYPADHYILPNRPPFRGGGSDSSEYAWFVWEEGKKERVYGLHRVLDSTPLHVRQAAKPPKLAPVPKRKYKGKLIVTPEEALAEAAAKKAVEDQAAYEMSENPT